MFLPLLPRSVHLLCLGSAAALALALPGATVFAADQRVAVVAHADPAYMEARRGPDGQPLDQTYFIVQGEFSPGAVRDRTLERTTIHEIARILAPELAKQRYLPSSSIEAADLMLVVHWGTTMRTRPDTEFLQKSNYESRDNRDFAQELRALDMEGEPENDMETQPNQRPTGQPGAPLNPTMSQRYAEEATRELFLGGGAWSQYNDEAQLGATRAESVAGILGFRRELEGHGRNPFNTAREHSLRSMMEDERYFIVIVAYDYQQYRASGNRNFKRLWVCRMSVHSPGMNFRQAVARIGIAGSPFFGTEQPTVALTRGRLREGVVEVGEPTVVSW
jgi:hypothetical protein